jgi:hypothetical protein
VKDLVVLVADKNQKAALDGLLSRPEALGIRPLSFDVFSHPRRDPGCFFEAPEFLIELRTQYSHALVLLDQEWAGAPLGGAAQTEDDLRLRLGRAGLQEWAEVVVINPELEVWVWSDSPTVAQCLGWPARSAELRPWLERQGLWRKGSPKPSAPKAAVETTLRLAGRQRSSALFRQLASRVSLRRCSDPSLARLLSILRSWFPPRRPGGKAT